MSKKYIIAIFSFLSLFFFNACYTKIATLPLEYEDRQVIVEENHYHNYGYDPYHDPYYAYYGDYWYGYTPVSYFPGHYIARPIIYVLDCDWTTFPLVHFHKRPFRKRPGLRFSYEHNQRESTSFRFATVKKYHRNNWKDRSPVSPKADEITPAKPLNGHIVDRHLINRSKKSKSVQKASKRTEKRKADSNTRVKRKRTKDPNKSSVQRSSNERKSDRSSRTSRTSGHSKRQKESRR
jgi:hypothetical protein